MSENQRTLRKRTAVIADSGPSKRVSRGGDSNHGGRKSLPPKKKEVVTKVYKKLSEKQKSQQSEASSSTAPHEPAEDVEHETIESRGSTSSSKKYSIKISFDDDIRKKSIHENITFEDFKEAVLKMYAKKVRDAGDDLVMRYKDEEGDMITIGDTSELKYAFESFPNLRIYVHIDDNSGINRKRPLRVKKEKDEPEQSTHNISSPQSTPAESADNENGDHHRGEVIDVDDEEPSEDAAPEPDLETPASPPAEQ